MTLLNSDGFVLVWRGEKLFYIDVGAHSWGDMRVPHSYGRINRAMEVLVGRHDVVFVSRGIER